MTFLGIVACQVGTALAARTERSSLREVGLTTNRLLLWGIAFELVFAAVLVATPIAAPLGMALPSWDALALLLPFPVVVWGADELWRARRRQSGARGFPLSRIRADNDRHADAAGDTSTEQEVVR